MGTPDGSHQRIGRAQHVLRESRTRRVRSLWWRPLLRGSERYGRERTGWRTRWGKRLRRRPVLRPKRRGRCSSGHRGSLVPEPARLIPSAGGRRRTLGAGPSNRGPRRHEPTRLRSTTARFRDRHRPTLQNPGIPATRSVGREVPIRGHRGTGIQSSESALWASVGADYLHDHGVERVHRFDIRRHAVNTLPEQSPSRASGPGSYRARVLAFLTSGSLVSHGSRRVPRSGGTLLPDADCRGRPLHLR